MSDPLQKVRRAANARRRAEANYRAALDEAASGPYTMQQLADAAGTSRQNIWKLTRKDKTQ